MPTTTPGQVLLLRLAAQLAKAGDRGRRGVRPLLHAVVLYPQRPRLSQPPIWNSRNWAAWPDLT